MFSFPGVGSSKLRLLLSVSVIGFAYAAVAQVPESCPYFQPVSNVAAPAIYSDNRGSIVDAQALAKRTASGKPVNDFLSYLSFSIDGPPPWNKFTGLSLQCANSLLEEWAKDDAMATTVDDHGSFSSQGAIDRAGYTRGFVNIAIKLQTAGAKLGPHVIPWLKKRVEERIQVDRAYIAHGQRGGNLLYEDGATAAGLALLTQDENAFKFQGEVWAYFLQQINPDGSLASELARGKRALVYHNRALSMLMILRAQRRALGIPEKAVDHAKIKALADYVGHSMCFPDELATKVGVDRIEPMDGDYAFRASETFGSDLLNADWQRCGRRLSGFAFIDATGGGDMRKMHQAIIQLGTQSRR
ncbi:alginate lyase family protein [Methylocella sp. CPCC 101449]|uniref:alginate lyase family protein n=1 Tax=Methylocella sp. CPCC 101449 TaxID=2987531 RepID=UPI00288F99EC|nr:alginate lyase family protein [Methylocella sp. CPCC 101449]MDT2019448.1 alginate lyase family protein [Methylocella sp. CPCC 101449]